MTKRALVIINRKARAGDQAADEVLETLQDYGIVVFEVRPNKNESLSDVILRHQDRADLVILGGGDGTLNAAVDGLIQVQLPVGILPLGTANDLARTLELPVDPIEACRVIGESHTRRIDVGCVNGKHFFNVASIGLSVDITRRLTKKAKKAWGVLA